jgi:hypothetical protein
MKKDTGSFVSKFADRSFLLVVGMVWQIWESAGRGEVPYTVAVAGSVVTIMSFIFAEKFKDSVQIAKFLERETAAFEALVKKTDTE